MLRGRSKRSAAVSSAVAALFFALIAGPATAGPDQSIDVEFRLGKDNGYRVDFVGSSFGDSASGLLMARRRLARGAEAVFYIKPRGIELTARRVRADFGPLGRVSVRFDERDRDVVKPPKGCEGRGTQRYGVFEGGFRFRGERGFAQVRGHRAAGEVQVGAVSSCGTEVLPARAARPDYFLTTCGARFSPLYFAQRVADMVAHYVSVTDRRGGIFITRNLYVPAPAGTFVVAQGTARLEPPPPFTGSAEYTDGRLTGDLSAPLPGLERPVSPVPAPASLERLTEGDDIGCGRQLRLPPHMGRLLP